MKIYAVQRGKVPGIYFTWEDTRPNVEKVENSCFKSFYCNTDLTKNQVKKILAEQGIEAFDPESDLRRALNEAIAFIETKIELSYDEIDLSKLERYLFIDGSFNKNTGVYGYGGFLCYKNKNGEPAKIIVQGWEHNDEISKLRNVAGEILGVLQGCEFAKKLKLPDLVIFYDYNGLSRWVSGEWKSKSKFVKAYVKQMKKNMNRVKITFVKVAGHTGIDGNEEADRLAKQAVGIINKEDEENGSNIAT